jgi:hypothetical protein
VVIAANIQHFTGKPWAATAQLALPQGDQRLQLEPRGTRRLSSQTLLDFRVSKSIGLSKFGRVELRMDVLNLLNDGAEEGLATDNLFSPDDPMAMAMWERDRRVDYRPRSKRSPGAAGRVPGAPTVPVATDGTAPPAAPSPPTPALPAASNGSAATLATAPPPIPVTS